MELGVGGRTRRFWHCCVCEFDATWCINTVVQYKIIQIRCCIIYHKEVLLFSWPAISLVGNSASVYCKYTTNSCLFSFFLYFIFFALCGIFLSVVFLCSLSHCLLFIHLINFLIMIIKQWSITKSSFAICTSLFESL